eukprot:809163-Pleurochrysis_carterae.AAC.1
MRSDASSRLTAGSLMYRACSGVERGRAGQLSATERTDAGASARLRAKETAGVGDNRRREA